MINRQDFLSVARPGLPRLYFSTEQALLCFEGESLFHRCRKAHIFRNSPCILQGAQSHGAAQPGRGPPQGEERALQGGRDLGGQCTLRVLMLQKDDSYPQLLVPGEHSLLPFACSVLCPQAGACWLPAPADDRAAHVAALPTQQCLAAAQPSRAPSPARLLDLALSVLQVTCRVSAGVALRVPSVL